MINTTVQAADNLSFVVLPENVWKDMFAEIKELKSIVQKKSDDDKKDEWIESTEVRKRLGISPKTWQLYRDERRIPFAQFGRKIYVKKGDLDKFMEQHYIASR